MFMWTVKYWKETNNKKTWICFRDYIKWKKERKIQLNGCRGRTRTSFKYVYLVCTGKYGSMDPHEKEQLYSKHQQKYKLMDSERKSKLCEFIKKVWWLGTRIKIDRLKNSRKKQGKLQGNQTYTLDHYITIFKQIIRECPLFTTCVQSAIGYFAESQF